MDIDIRILGTSEAIPTARKGQTAILVKSKNETILIDCGEGTQRQMRIAKLNPCSITRIFITHWHGDHILGLPGLLQTLSLNNYSKTLYIYGPRGTKRFMKLIMALFLFIGKVKVVIKEVNRDGLFFENKDFRFDAYRMKHSCPCLAYSIMQQDKRKIKPEFIKKIPGLLLGKLQQGRSIKLKGKIISAKRATFFKSGKKVVFIFDTLFNKNCIKISKNSYLLVSEATFLDSQHANRARERKHLTAKQAALIAKRAKVKKLILLHISQRYTGKEQKILREAKKTFKNTQLAEDFMELRI